MFQEVIMFEISVSPLFGTLYGGSQGCGEGHLRFSISAENVITIKESGSVSESNGEVTLTRGSVKK